MIEPGTLRNSVSLYTVSTGGTATLYRTWFCAIESQGSREYWSGDPEIDISGVVQYDPAANARTTANTFRLTGRRDASINNTMRVIWGTCTLEVLETTHDEATRETTTIVCREVKTN